MNKKKKIIIASIVGLFLIIIASVLIYFHFFAKTPEQKTKEEVQVRIEEAINLFYEMDVTKDEIKEYAIDYDVATEYLNFSTRNYVNISAEDDSEAELITLRRKDELVEFFDNEMQDLLEITQKYTSYKVLNVYQNDDKEKYQVELEIHPFDMEAYYTYVADFVVLFVSEAEATDTYEDFEEARVQFMKDVYTGKALAVKLFNHYYLDDFILDETYTFTATMVQEDGVWKVENLDTLQAAFNGIYASKYIQDNERLDYAEERQARVLEIYKECIQKGIIDASNIRSIDDILDNY